MFNVKYFPYTLRFTFPAGTSRGVLNDKTSWFVLVTAEGRTGIGEAGPLPGLSPDDRPDFEEHLSKICTNLQKVAVPKHEQDVEKISAHLAGEEFPSIRFALETALLDWLMGGERVLYDNLFSRGQEAIPINGLIWMGDKELMRQRMREKLQQGFTCLKMKIGSIHFEEELAILSEIRKHFSAGEVTIRVDANGAFPPEEALRKLEQLAKFDIHSIEQPIKAGQPDEMYRLCRDTPIPIALDEELIGIPVHSRGLDLLQQIKPQYIILKPSLLGGMAVSRRWIELAGGEGIGWWITSALESNIGLNAISQFTAEYPVKMPQGLGTGQLYHNNIPAPLRIEKGNLRYLNENGNGWDLEIFDL